MSIHRPTRRQFTLGLTATVATGLLHTSSAQESTPPKVVATFSILGDWVQRVAGDVLTVSTVVPSGGDTHTFDPSPEQVGAIADADLIFEIGLGFETWLDGMFTSSGTQAIRVVVSDGVEVLHFGDEGDAHDHDEEDHDDDGHDHGNDDPHIWGDTQNAIIAVTHIAAALGEADPANSATYDANAAAYITELESLDEAIRTDTSTIPEDLRKLVTTHDTLGYYAHAYGFEIVGTALGSISTEGGDPSAQDIATLVTDIQATGVKAIFADNVSSNSLMESIAAEAGVELAPPLYTDALGEPGSDGATYIDMMTTNTNVIVDALG